MSPCNTVAQIVAVSTLLNYDVSHFFNQQPHIDACKVGMTSGPIYSSERYTFMLKHKHFDLNPGEVLWVDHHKHDYTVKAVPGEDAKKVGAPCMWLFTEKWMPFAYTQEALGSEETPDVPPGEYNIGLRWLNSGGTETTSVKDRTQIVRKKNLGGFRSILTMTNHQEDETSCTSECVALNKGYHKTHLETQ